MAIPLNDNIKINAPKPSDPRYFAPDNTPWASVVAVEAGIPLTERHDNLPVSIMGVEYWWKDGAWVVKESTTITNHISNTSNPHNVTKSQVGLSNVPNLSFSGSNTGDETILSIQSKRPLKSVKGQSLEGSGNIDLSKSDVGLSNVDNTSDANKPISTAQQTALNAKEPTIPSGTTGQYYRGDKTWQTLNKTTVGLNNVDNTADLNKPISTATQTALNAKENLSDYLNIVSSATPVTLTSLSPRLIIVSGSAAQTIILPVTSTLSLGYQFTIINNSSNTTTVQSSGGNAMPATVANGISCNFYCILTSGTTSSSWQQEFTGSNSRTGNGGLVYSNFPFLATPSYTITPTHTSGTNAQGSGTISSDVTVVTSTPNNPSGVTLVGAGGSGIGSRHITIINKGTNPINVFPLAGTTIDDLGVNNPYLLQVNAVVVFRSTTATQWYSESAIASDSEMQTGADNAKTTTALRIANWFAWIKTQAQTWAAKQTFSAAPRYSTTTASQFLRVDANKDLVSVSEASDTEMQTGAENTKPTTALRIANWFAWRLAQSFTLGNLVGTGNRVMQVNSVGDVSAPYNIQDGFVTDSDVITAITGATYNSGNNFTANLTPANSKVFNQGQFYKNLGVLYFATADNQSSRITLS